MAVAPPADIPAIIRWSFTKDRPIEFVQHAWRANSWGPGSFALVVDASFQYLTSDRCRYNRMHKNRASNGTKPKMSFTEWQPSDRSRDIQKRWISFISPALLDARRSVHPMCHRQWKVDLQGAWEMIVSSSEKENVETWKKLWTSPTDATIVDWLGILSHGSRMWAKWLKNTTDHWLKLRGLPLMYKSKPMQMDTWIPLEMEVIGEIGFRKMHKGAGTEGTFVHPSLKNVTKC